MPLKTKKTRRRKRGMQTRAYLLVVLLLLGLVFLCLPLVSGEPDDADALLALKMATDPSNALPWRRGGGAVCSWVGVRQCSSEGRVTKLVLEFFNLTGELSGETLSSLNQLRVLSFKSNFLFGEIPDLSAITGLKSLYLNNNRFSGKIPPSLCTLHRLKTVVLSGNMITGEIPASLTRLRKLHALLLQDNLLTGPIPPFEQTGLKLFNVSGNHLSGEIPRTAALMKFNASSFTGNPNVCGDPLEKMCLSLREHPFPPSSSPVASVVVSSSSYSPPTREEKNNRKRVASIVASSVGAFLFLAIFTGLVAAFFLVPWRRTMVADTGAAAGAGKKSAPAEAEGGVRSSGEQLGGAGKDGDGDGFSWEGGRLGNLVFCGEAGEMYCLEELLKASAETLGKGTVGSTYKAVMETGFIVTVKRLKSSSRPGQEEFRRRMETLGRLRHPNLVPLRAYFMAKEERLLVYDYFPNGSLYSLIHGSRPSGGGKPLHWTSCLKISEDVATGLLYLHQNIVIHGNLKSSNVLLGPDFESCLTDYGLVPYLCSSDGDEDCSGSGGGGAVALFYRAPESRSLRRSFTQQSDVYSFGILLLELLTGKTPFHDLVEEHGEGIPEWVRSVRAQETESGDDPVAGSDNAEKVGALVEVAMACLSPAPEVRPTTKEVVRMIRDARVEVLASSNSSDHSPGRWSGTVQSLPREYGSDHLNFAERD